MGDWPKECEGECQCRELTDMSIGVKAKVRPKGSPELATRKIVG